MAMVQPTYPGVYIVEKPSGVRTITGVATSIAAFLGRTSNPVVLDCHGPIPLQVKVAAGGKILNHVMRMGAKPDRLNDLIKKAVVSGPGDTPRVVPDRRYLVEDQARILTVRVEAP